MIFERDINWRIRIMLKKILSCFTLPLLLFFLNNSSGDAAPGTMQSAPEGRNPGPDIVTGDVGQAGGLEQFGSSGTQVGLGVSTTCDCAGRFGGDGAKLPVKLPSRSKSGLRAGERVG